MHIQKRHLTRHRRQRYVLWALAMLAWIASVFAGSRITSRQAHQRGDISLQGLTRMVMELVVIRAGEVARIRRRNLAFFKRGRDLRRSHLLRSVIGSRLRRTLKRRDIAAHIANLIAVLRDLDAFARPVAQRLRRGLTRLFPITRIAPSFDTILGPPAPTPALTDTSEPDLTPQSRSPRRSTLRRGRPRVRKQNPRRSGGRPRGEALRKGMLER